MFLESCRKQLDAYRIRNTNRKAYRSLCQFNDHLLKDIGLNRAQIITFSNFEKTCEVSTRGANNSKIKTSKPRNPASVFGWHSLRSVVGI